MAVMVHFEMVLVHRDIVTQSSAEGHYHSTFPGNWFYALFSEQAEQHISLLLVVGSVKQRVRISLWNLFFFLSFFSHCSLDKNDLTDSVLFVVSSYSPPLIIPSFGHSEAEVCYYLHPLSTLLSNLFFFPVFFFFSFLADESDVSYYLLRVSGMEKGTRRTRRGHHVYSASPTPPPLPPPFLCART